MLEVSDLHAYYGKSHILQGVHLKVDGDEIVSILGRNGVGRSTTLKAIMGDVPPHGSIAFKGESIVGLRPYEIAHRGIGYVPEDRAIFPTLTVEQNLLLGVKAGRRSTRWSLEDTHRLFPVLAERARAPAGVLSGGEQQMQAPQEQSHAMVRLLARVIGVGIETADMLVHEILSRSLRDRRAVARYAGLTGAPDESGSKRQEKGLAKAGNARVRRGMIQLAWRFLLFQKDSALAQWYRARTESAGKKRKTMIVALARKLLIALWRLVTTGEVPAGVVLRAA